MFNNRANIKWACLCVAVTIFLGTSMSESAFLAGYGWAQVCSDVDERYALASNVFTGVAARIDLDDGKLMQVADTGMTAPHRALAGVAAFGG